ncbi:hypothetical protein [Aquimarina sp. 2304DJ70-9]|uniref:hypothetical protein n=1 Tax=Aquimarina penaris TaxID=3231044 RepID=UPI0034621B10
MKRFGKVMLIIVSVVIILFLWATWYKYEYSMEEAQQFEVNSKELTQKLLIATQGSEFKDTITNSIVNHYKPDSIFIKVIDVSSLTEVQPENYTAIVLIHTWENWKPPYVVRQFVERSLDHKNKMIVMTTSGNGTYMMSEVDAITGESNLEEAPDFVHKIVARLEPILDKNR